MRRRLWKGGPQTFAAAVLLIRLHWEFHLRGKSYVGALTRDAMRTTPTAQTELDALEVDPWRIARAVSRAKRRLPFDSTCLQTALATQRLLARQGVSSAVRVGIDRIDAPAHAWVEVGDLVIDDQGISARFTPFAAPGERANV